MIRDIFKKGFEEAINDYEVGLILIKSEKYNCAVFHFQQATEKILKAALYFYDQQPWGHSSLELIKHIVKRGKKEYKKFLSYAREIDTHYTTTRYPDTLPGIGPKDAYDKKIAENIKEKVSEIIEFIQSDFENEVGGGI